MKARKIRARRTRKQRGGRVNTFQVYLFTNSAPSKEDKENLLMVLESLYGSVNEITDFTNFKNDFMKEQIKEFVYEKGRHYPTLTTVTGFSLAIPDRLNKGIMNDPKLTKEEYTIRDSLLMLDLPFKLVDAQHGLWSEEVAIIALEHI
jgi:hypothetical protein